MDKTQSGFWSALAIAASLTLSVGTAEAAVVSRPLDPIYVVDLGSSTEVDTSAPEVTSMSTDETVYYIMDFYYVSNGAWTHAPYSAWHKVNFFDPAGYLQGSRRWDPVSYSWREDCARSGYYENCAATTNIFVTPPLKIAVGYWYKVKYGDGTWSDWGHTEWDILTVQ